MTLESVQFEIDKLENDLLFYKNRKEELLSIVMPKVTNATATRVDGGERVDKYLKYIEKEEKYQINITIEYIEGKLKHLYEWMENELKILRAYGDTLYELVFLKEVYKETDKYGFKRKLTWDEISEKMDYSARNLQYMYYKYKKNGPNCGPKL